MEEVRLDCLVIEIIEYKKEATARQIELEQNLAKEKEVMEMLAVMIGENHTNNVTATVNKKKLKKEKEFKGGLIACALSSFFKSTESPLTTTLFPTTVSFLTSISSSFATNQPRKNKPIFS